MSTRTVLSYEVHLLLKGVWRVDSMFDDFDLAERAAKQSINSTFKPLSVRVVKQTLDPATNLIGTHTVFRWSRTDAGNQQAEVEIRRQRSDFLNAKSGTSIAAPIAKRRKTSLAWLSFLLIVLLCGGVAALIGVEYLSKIL